MTTSKKQTKICKYCGKEFEGTSVQVFCCREHLKLYLNHKKFPDGSDYVECEICGSRGGDLFNHIRCCHKMTQEEYLSKFGLAYEDLMCETTRKRKAEATRNSIKSGKKIGFTSENNPAKSKECKDGKYSPFSMNFKGYDGLTPEEKQYKIEQLLKTAKENQNLRNNNSTRLNYYTSRGYSKIEAKKMLKERQSTFNLKKCIEKYGEEEGRKRWKERQEKWQNTLNNLPKEEIERIYKAKMMNGRGYSNISQELFFEIYKRLNGKFKKVYFAKLNANDENENNEYMVMNPITKKKYFLDFYIGDTNKVIEFDGDYWHGERRGNQERDRNREEDLINLGYKIFRVKERDYKADPEKVVNECLNFLNEP